MTWIYECFYERYGQLLFIANRNTPGMSTRASNGGDAEIWPDRACCDPLGA